MYIVIYSSGDCADILDNELQSWRWWKFTDKKEKNKSV